MIENAPPILEVVEGYGMTPRRVGREFVTNVPWREVKHPSLRINIEKNVWYDVARNEGGDAILFVQKIEGVNFTGALKILGLADGPKPSRAEIERRKAERERARSIASWAFDFSAKIAGRMRVLGQEARLSRDVIRGGGDVALLRDHIDRLGREWSVLADLQDDLFEPELTAELYQRRDVLDGLIADSDRDEYSDDDRRAYCGGAA